MTFLESILFLILYISFGAGIPLLWYAKQVSKHRLKHVNAHTRFRVHSDKTFEEAHRDAILKTRPEPTRLTDVDE